MNSSSRDRKRLLSWYEEVARPLPWRKTKDPYKIWISEVMLQQTTVKAVIPYYKKFIKKFPAVDKLAQAKIEHIYELWAGLGYYSRARMLHKAARELHELGHFPDNYQDLLKLPGFGDYTSRAVASIAFGESVGVVDGNVIRVLTRRFDLDWEWWKTKEKRELQAKADELAQSNSSEVNQALMELGATVCTPKNPTCLLCPLGKNCLARKNQTIEQRPRGKKRKETQILHWRAQIVRQGNKIGFVKNTYAPFLKNQWLLPGKVQMRKVAPKSYDFQHAITHYKIFVTITRERSKFDKSTEGDILWLSAKQLKEKVPFSLIQKAIDIGLDDSSK